MIDIDRLGAFFDDLSADSPPIGKGRVRVSQELDMQNKVLVLGASALARMRLDARIKEQLQAIYDNRRNISAGAHEKLRDILLDLGCHDFIEEREKEWREEWGEGVLVWYARWYQADQNMLETILRLTSSPVASAKRRRKLRTLTVLLYALGVHEARVGDWHILSRLDGSKAIEAVLSGYISALRLNKDELAQDAAWALAELGRINQHGVRTRSLFSLLPRFPASKEEYHADSINTSVPDLVRALACAAS